MRHTRSNGDQTQWRNHVDLASKLNKSNSSNDKNSFVDESFAVYSIYIGRDVDVPWETGVGVELDEARLAPVSWASFDVAGTHLVQGDWNARERVFDFDARAMDDLRAIGENDPVAG